MTEVSIATSLLGSEFIGIDDTLSPLCRSIGRPFEGLDVRLVDDKGVELPFDGESRGELELSGSFVTPGYLDDPAANAEAFDGEWLRTGDVAVIDKQRNITIVDRKKDIIVSGGINIAPTEVEQAIRGIPRSWRLACARCRTVSSASRCTPRWSSSRDRHSPSRTWSRGAHSTLRR